MKKIIFVIVIVLTIILISVKINYHSNIDLYFGNNNSKYVYKYNNTRITDIISDIKSNIIINDKYIQNLLVKSNHIYIDLKGLEIYSLDDIDDLFKTVRYYTKEKVYVHLYKDKRVNNRIFKIKDDYDIMIVR